MTSTATKSKYLTALYYLTRARKQPRSTAHRYAVERGLQYRNSTVVLEDFLKAIELEPYTPVRVTWVDSTFEAGWHYNRQPGPRILDPVVTLGFVTHSDDDVLEVSSTIGVKRGALNPLIIPWGAITEAENLAAVLEVRSVH